MTPEKLRKSIFKFAVQGKLSVQKEEDGTADDLLNAINLEKSKSLPSKTIKKDTKRWIINDNDKPYVLPKGWSFVRLGQIVKISTGDKDANFGKAEGKYSFFTCAKFPIKCDTYAFDGEAILLAGNGDIGNISIFDGKFDAYQRTYVLQPYIKHSYLKYIYYHLLFNWLEYNNNKMFGSAIPYIRLGNVQEYIIALPPLKEQERIIKKIEELLPFVDRYGKVWAKLEKFNKEFPIKMEKSILQYAIKGKLVNQKDDEENAVNLYNEIISERNKFIKAKKIKKTKLFPSADDSEKRFPIPSGWKWVRIGNIFNLQAGKNISSSEIFEEKTKEHPYPCYGGNGIRGYVNKFNRDGFYSIIGRQGALCGNVNLAHGKFYATEHAVVVEHYNKTNVLWGSYFLKALNLNQYATATAQPGLAVSNIDNVLIPLPPLKEQERIVAKIEELLPLCKKLIRE